MIYIQLTNPYATYTKIFIGNINIFDTKIKDGIARLSFSYEARNDEDISLFVKTISIKEISVIDEIKSATISTLNLYDTVCKRLLEYLIENSIETGTLEIK